MQVFFAKENNNLNYCFFYIIFDLFIIDIYQDYKIDKIINGNVVMDYEINMTGICKNCLKEGE